MTSLSVVVPVFNSDRSLVELADRLHACLPGVVDSFEIVFVNDGGAPSSWVAIRDLTTRYTNVTGIALSRNYGQHNALLAGIRAASGDVIATMDDDLQHPPEVLPDLLAALTDDVDLVYGHPVEENHEWWRNASSRLTKAAMAASLGPDVAEKAGAFRVFRSRLRAAFADTTDPFVSIDVLLSWATNRVAAVPVPLVERPYGRSNYSFRKLVRHAANMVTGYSTTPVRFGTDLGFGFSFLGVAILVVVLANYLIHGAAVPGFAFLASLIAVMSGAQLFALGVLGEYLGRIHFRTMRKPPYAIRSTVRSSAIRDPSETIQDLPCPQLPPDEVDRL
ncbi:MAG: glycosyltransferase family 2 protein [Acidimicrobiales bacterium]|nr:glycosyltransferase family 2 protein [Acidimicrobiales bacterium]